LPEKYVLKISKIAQILHDSCPKNYQNTRIFMIFSRKNLQNSRILHDFARKMPEFYVIIARKIFFPNFRGARAPMPPVSYAYAS